MPELTTVVIDVALPYEVYQSYQAELREAKAHVAAQRYRDATASAHRAWEYYGEGVLALLGKTKTEINNAAKQITLGLHETEHRRFYEQRTGDSLANHRSWSKLFDGKRLRDKAEHRGKPVSETQAREALQLRVGLMRHIDGVLSRTPGLDQEVLKHASDAREAVV